jgi:hypothetical protein
MVKNSIKFGLRVGKVHLLISKNLMHLIQFSDKDGTTGYYSKNCTSEDAEKVKKVLI